MGKDSDKSTVGRGCLLLFSMLFTLLAAGCIGSSLFLILVIIYGYLHIDKVWKSFGSFGLIAFILLLVAVGIIIIVGLMGFCGAICRDRCCLIFYTMFVLILCGLMTALAIVAIILPPNYFST
jgi:hypothetical protein